MVRQKNGLCHSGFGGLHTTQPVTSILVPNATHNPGNLLYLSLRPSRNVSKGCEVWIMQLQKCRLQVHTAVWYRQHMAWVRNEQINVISFLPNNMSATDSCLRDSVPTMLHLYFLPENLLAPFHSFGGLTSSSSICK